MRSGLIMRFTVLVIFALLSFTVGAKTAIGNNGNAFTFVKNVGQVTDTNQLPRNDIDYSLSINNLSVFISNGQLQYQWHTRKTVKDTDTSVKEYAELYTMQVKLIGANKNAIGKAEDEQGYYERYYLPYCNGKTAYSYNKITYKDVYPNIDWVLYTNNAGELKYDFIVHSGGNASAIRLKYVGASNVKLQDGAIKVTTPMGSITEQKPYSYDIVTKHEVKSNYILEGNEVHFDIAKSENGVVIDPKINWSDNLPDSGYAYAIAADTLGNSYVCGYTFGLANVATPGAYQTTYSGGATDAFICKYNIDGVKQWSTYYGGNKVDKIQAATTSFAGDLYVTGVTTSTNQISGGANPQKTTYAGVTGSTQNDAFVARFDASGNFIWGTYAGGPESDAGAAIVCDNLGSVYIGGTTTDTTSDTTGNFYKGYQSTPGPGFFSRYNAGDGHRIWSSFFNGEIKALVLDNRGNMFIGGSTSIYVGVATSNTHQPLFTANPFNTNGFVCRFRALTGIMSWGTYYGGEQDNQLFSLTCDSFGSVYAGGLTSSSTGISTPGAFQIKRVGVALAVSPPRAPYYSGFIAKLDSTGKRVWGTYYSGVVNSILLSPDHKIYVGGSTSNDSGITTPDAIQTTQGAGFIGKMTIDGKRIWGTYYGCNLISYGGTFAGIAGGNRIFSGGYYPTTQFVADTSVYFKFPYVDTLLCAGGALHINYGVTNLFRPGNVFTVQLSDAAGSFASAGNIGNITYDDRKDINCTIPLSTPQGVGYKLRIISSAPADTFYNYNMPIRISAYPHPDAVAIQPICTNQNLTMTDNNAPAPAGTEYKWISPNPLRSPGLFTPNIVNNITLADSGDYRVIADNHGCIGSDTLHVHVNVSPTEPTVTGDTSLCIGDTLHLLASSPLTGTTFAWFRPDNSFGGYTPIVDVPAVVLSDSGKYRISVEQNGCQSSPLFGQVVTVHPLPQPAASSNTPLCPGDVLKLNATDTTQNVTYAWSGPGGYTGTNKDENINNVEVSASGVYTVKTTTIHGCTNTSSTTVAVLPAPDDLQASANSPLCEGDTLRLSSHATTGASYSWSGPGNFSANTSVTSIGPVVTGQSGLYTITAEVNGCTRIDTARVVIAQVPPKPSLSSNSPLSIGGILRLYINNAQTGISYSWIGPRGFSTSIVNPALNSVLPDMSGTYIAIATNGICTSSDSIAVYITDQPGITADKPFIIFPNPNNGTFRLKGETQTDEPITIAVFASDGKEVYRASFAPVNKQVDQVISITGLANGVYRLKLDVERHRVTYSFTVKGNG